MLLGGIAQLGCADVAWIDRDRKGESADEV
jgi:hypothetical protein